MARPSNIDLLPRDLRENINAWLNDPAVTQQEIVRRVNGVVEAINASRSEGERIKPIHEAGLSRHAQQAAEMGLRIRQSREAAEVITGQLKNLPAGEMGTAIVQGIQAMAFDAINHAMGTGEPMSAQEINKLALAAQRIEQATSINQRREEDIRAAERERIAAELSKSTDTDGKISAERLREIVRESYGV